MKQQDQEFQAEIVGQRFWGKNMPLNTIATVATLVVTSIVAYVLYQHEVYAAARHIDYVAAVRDQTQAMREATRVQRMANCLTGYQGPPAEKTAFCERVTR